MRGRMFVKGVEGWKGGEIANRLLIGAEDECSEGRDAVWRLGEPVVCQRVVSVGEGE